MPALNKYRLKPDRKSARIFLQQRFLWFFWRETYGHVWYISDFESAKKFTNKLNESVVKYKKNL